jgi:hypothetical protein
MLKRRLKQAGLPAHYSPHSFRATGITNFLENHGTLEAAQRIAGHADSRTTKLYDRRGQKVLLEDMERNAELGISLQMPSTIKCGVRPTDGLWTAPSRDFTRHFFLTLLLFDEGQAGGGHAPYIIYSCAFDSLHMSAGHPLEAESKSR